MQDQVRLEPDPTSRIGTPRTRYVVSAFRRTGCSAGESKMLGHGRIRQIAGRVEGRPQPRSCANSISRTSAGRRADEGGSRRRLRHRRQPVQAAAARRADHHGPRERRLPRPRRQDVRASTRASRKGTSCSWSTTSRAATASGTTWASTATAPRRSGSTIRRRSATATPPSILRLRCGAASATTCICR